jgi:hypothetical protein
VLLKLVGVSGRLKGREIGRELGGCCAKFVGVSGRDGVRAPATGLTALGNGLSGRVATRDDSGVTGREMGREMDREAVAGAGVTGASAFGAGVKGRVAPRA